MAVQPRIPFWLKQRQGKTETAGETVLRLTAPNIPEAFVGIRQDGDGRWRPLLRETSDGTDFAPAELAYDTPVEAWEAAFELHREKYIL
jgi:hypothetical protein